METITEKWFLEYISNHNVQRYFTLVNDPRTINDVASYTRNYSAHNYFKTEITLEEFVMNDFPEFIAEHTFNMYILATDGFIEVRGDLLFITAHIVSGFENEDAFITAWESYEAVSHKFNKFYDEQY